MAARASKTATKEPPPRRVRKNTNPAPIITVDASPAESDLPRIFTIPEVAALLRVHEMTIHRLIQRGKIHTTTVATRRFVPEAELRRLLREGTS